MEGPLPRWQRAMAWIAPQAPEHDAGSPPTSASTSSTLAVTNYHSYLSQDWSNALVWTPRGVPEQDEKTRRDSSKQAETPMTGDMSQYQTPTSTTTLPFSPATEDTSYRQPLFPPRTQRPVSVDLDAKDRAHPRNWPMRRRALINTALNLWTFAVVFASTAYVSSVPDLEVEFGISQTVALLGVSLYVGGFGAGPLLFGPLSELFGRRPIYIASAVPFAVMSWCVSESNNASMLLSCRFLAGFTGSTALNNVPATISDITTLAERNRFTAFYSLAAFAGPCMGPLVSSFVNERLGFRNNLRVVAAWATCTSLMVLLVPETRSRTIAKRVYPHAGGVTFRQTFGFLKLAMMLPFLFLFTEPIVASTSLYLAIIYGILYGAFEGYVVVWVEERQWSVEKHGLTYVSLAIGFFVGLVILATVQERRFRLLQQTAMAQRMPIPASARLFPAFIAAIIIPASLFMFAFTAPSPEIHWLAPCAAEMLFACGMLLCFTGLLPYIVDVYESRAASALAAGTTSRSILAAAFPLFSMQMYHGLGVRGASCLLAGVSLLLAPVPFVFSRYDHKLRARSRFAPHK